MKLLLTAVNAKYIHSNLAVYSLKASAGAYGPMVRLAEYTVNQPKDDIFRAVYSKKPAPRAGFYKKREKYEKNLSNNCFLLFDDFILQEDCEQPVSEG